MGIHMSKWPDLSFEANAADRRAYPRFTISLTGLCSITGGGDVACWTKNMSLGGIAVHCEATAEVGNSVLFSFPQMGLLKGTVVRTSECGFAAAFDGGQNERSKIASYLVWMICQHDDSSIEDRRFERIVPFNRIVLIRRADGAEITSRIQDVSRSGIAFSTTVLFAVGECIRIGERPAVVVRLVEGGVAARFEEELDESFDATIRF